MHIVHHKPAARGVSQLMYVGDDQAVENAVTAPTPMFRLGVVVGLVLLFTMCVKR